MTSLALAVAALGLYALFSRGGASLGATIDEIASARLIAAARLRQFEDERQERFRRYHLSWTLARRREPGRVYVAEFGSRRG